MAPQLVIQFWSEVQRRLTDDHNLHVSEAQRLIQAYRLRLKSHRVGEAVFNRGEEAAVATILNAVESGFPEPQLIKK